MSRIRILSDALASQVAAGEVVERPAAVIRELVDNSLDAGATHVEVHVQRGGTALIKVVDNGQGMDREDAMLCLERHATSKIRTKEDLSSIATLGFRGEALPSIASVSRFRLASREHSALTGTEVEVNGGKLATVRDYGGAPGTKIEVAALFYNIPARRKFLRSEPTEFAHVEQQFRLQAIANPEVAFSLVKDGEVLYHLPATKDVLSRIEGITGKDLAQRLIRIEDYEQDRIRIRGYIGSAGISRPNRQLTLTFLNRRPVDSPALSYGLREGYHTALMKGQHPVTFLFVEMPPETFDINVHPAKKEVRFHSPHALQEAVVRCVSGALAEASRISGGHAPIERPATQPLPVRESTGLLIPEAEQKSLRRDWSALPAWPATGRPADPQVVATPAPEPVWQSRAAGESQAPPPAHMPQHEEREAPHEVASADRAEPASGPSREAAASAPEPAVKATVSAPQFRIMGVLNKLYVLMEGADGLVLMDQHAAHERVLFEQMRLAMEQAGVPTQRLLLPLTLQVSPKDYDLLSRNLDVLARLGIEAEAFGNNALKIDSLPSFLRTDDPIEILRDIIDELASASSRTSSLRLGEDMIATTVCRHAVKANDELRIPELQKLLQDLFVCEMPYCCPHGRPTLIQITYAELEKKFGRRAP